MSHRLVLVRHAQAADTHPRGDHERELTAQGVADATELGRWLAGRQLAPDHVVVSTARRAQQTLEALREGLGQSPLLADRVWSERRVYDGGTDGVLAAVQEVPEETGVLWVVGHEPVMSSTAYDLADPARTPDRLRRALGRGFPTATAAVLDLPVPWARVAPGSGRPRALHTGRSSG